MLGAVEMFAALTSVRGMALLFVAIVAFAGAPFALVLGGMQVASAFGCNVNDGDNHPCIVLGVDVGDVVYGAFVAGWLGFATVPLGALLLLCWVVAAVVLLVHRWRTKQVS